MPEIAFASIWIKVRKARKTGIRGIPVYNGHENAHSCLHNARHTLRQVTNVCPIGTTVVGILNGTRCFDCAFTSE